jgi:heat-inducible transcriptional repressor
LTIANFGYNIYKEISNLNFQVLKKEVIKVLDKRKKEILQAVVDEYINTAEPVSSATLVEKYGLNYSSATVRNELAELENNGYLDKPHTSSGRVPSEKGYRFYVDELVNEEDISLEEIKYIQTKLATKVNEIEDLTKIATSTLSEITHYTTVAIRTKTR